MEATLAPAAARKLQDVSKRGIPSHVNSIPSVSDDKIKPGGQDRTRINVNEDQELRDWSKKFSARPEPLKAAVKDAGTNALAVEQQLKQSTDL